MDCKFRYTAKASALSWRSLKATGLIASVSVALMFGWVSDDLQAFSPTQEQIEHFKSLSPAEQQRLAKSMGVSLPTQSSQRTAPVESPETVEPRKVSVEKERKEEKAEVAAPSTEEKVAEEQSVKAEEKKLLQPFGYELFAGNPTTFAPATDIPVPVDYSIGPGDSIIVQLYGKENSTNELVVSREGEIQFPEIGPISVNGLHFGDLKKRINQLVSEQMIGVKASVTMGALRSIRVFVLGEAYKPGSYTVSSLSTMTNALFASGGIETIGSLRHIVLKRNGKTVGELDLYDLLLDGDTSNDKRLMPGDVLFIPTVKKTVSISGEVRRPGIYEVKDEKTLAEMVELAGGYSSEAFPAAARVQRVNAQGSRTVADVNLKKRTGQNTPLRDGDLLEIPSVLGKLENVVSVSGHVHREGFFNWQRGLKVKDVITGISDLKANPDLTIALVKREQGETRKTKFISFNLGAALRGDNIANLTLQPRDELIVFPAGASDRAAQLEESVSALKSQHAGEGHPPTVKLLGEVRSQGVYPLAENMSVAKALRMAGYLTVDGSRKGVLLARQHPINNTFEFHHLRIGGHSMDELLRPRDQILVFSRVKNRVELLEPILSAIDATSIYGLPAPITTIAGAVRFPGTYPLVNQATVETLIALAGGLKEEAYKVSGEISRVETLDSEDSYSTMHQTVSLHQPDGLATPLQSRDRLVVKSVPEWGETIEVVLNGEVRFPGTYPVTKGETISDLILRAGGLTNTADPKGAVFLRESLKKKEQEMLDRFKGQIEEEAAAVAADRAAQDEEIVEVVALKDNLLSQIQETPATGRLVFNLPGILKNKKHVVDVVLRDGDKISIPPLIQEVSILGEVNFPTSHLYQKGGSAGDYIDMSGGTTRKADKKNAYVISRDGAVRPMYRWKFLWFGMKRNLKPGDTLVVPTDIDRLHPLTVWQKTSQILFQLATTAAALNTVGAL